MTGGTMVRIAAIFTAVVIVLASLYIVAINPTGWSDILAFSTPTVMALLVLGKLESYHQAVNSKMDKLLELTAKASRAEGVLEERASRPHHALEKNNRQLTDAAAKATEGAASLAVDAATAVLEAAKATTVEAVSSVDAAKAVK
jgi:hypothetical protein